MKLMIAKLTAKSMGVLVENKDRTREFVVTATVLENATDTQNQQFMQELKLVYEKYRQSVERQVVL